MSLIRRGRLRAGTQALVMLLLALTGVVLTSMPAHACSCVRQTFKDQSTAADVVFTGVVDAVSAPSGGAVSYDITADRVFKGELTYPVVTVTSPAGGAACGLGDLPADRPYVFLVAQAGSTFSADSCGGTAPVSARTEEQVGRLLGAGRPVTPPAPESATYTRVEESAPTSLARLAAPGAALVILGLLGLMVVRRLGRR